MSLLFTERMALRVCFAFGPWFWLGCGVSVCACVFVWFFVCCGSLFLAPCSCLLCVCVCMGFANIKSSSLARGPRYLGKFGWGVCFQSALKAPLDPRSKIQDAPETLLGILDLGSRGAFKAL